MRNELPANGSPEDQSIRPDIPEMQPAAILPRIDPQPEMYFERLRSWVTRCPLSSLAAISGVSMGQREIGAVHLGRGTQSPLTLAIIGGPTRGVLFRLWHSGNVVSLLTKRAH